VEVQIRIGLNSGDVVVRSVGSDLPMDYTAVGQTTHLAARMEQLAPPGRVRLLCPHRGATDDLRRGQVPAVGDPDAELHQRFRYRSGSPGRGHSNDTSVPPMESVA
jgi:class 3 adenylate cyclase